MKVKHPKIYSKSQIERIRESGKITKKVLEIMKDACVIGNTLIEVDNIGKEFLDSVNAKSACYGYRNFPRYSCISVDDTILHGIPDKTIITEGMMIGIDCPVKYKGMYSDSAINVGVGKVDETKIKLSKVAYDCLMETINIIKPGVTIGEVCSFQQEYAKKYNYDVIKTFRGHGVGRNLHEPPHIPYFYDENNLYNDYKLKKGNVIAVEPTVVSNDELYVLDDGWGYKTTDGSFGTSWEHTVLVTDDGFEILT